MGNCLDTHMLILHRKCCLCGPENGKRRFRMTTGGSGLAAGKFRNDLRDGFTVLRGRHHRVLRGNPALAIDHKGPSLCCDRSGQQFFATVDHRFHRLRLPCDRNTKRVGYFSVCIRQQSEVQIVCLAEQHMVLNRVTADANYLNPLVFQL